MAASHLHPSITFSLGVSPQKNFRENLRFSQKSKIFAKIQDFRKNPRFSENPEIFAKIQDFRDNPRFSRKSKIFSKIRDFRKNLRFSRKFKISSKSEICAKIVKNERTNESEISGYPGSRVPSRRG